MNDKIYEIKDVAIYLRKSRGDEDDLKSHKSILVDYCKEKKWRFQLYEEIGDSQSLKSRSEIQRLMDDVKNGEFDAIMVIDKDRLSREGVSQAYINKVLSDNECLIITPNKIYDLSNEADYIQTEMEDMFARIEYRMTKKRLRRGKRQGAKRGNWVNGVPPLPYKYNRENKSLEVDPEQLPLYRRIVEEYLSVNSVTSITHSLNKDKIPSPRGGLWSKSTVYGLLISETHLGKVIYNREKREVTEDEKVRYKINDRSQWIVVDNCHEAVKTEDEHILIMSTMEKRARGSRVKGNTPFSGLIVCKKCGKAISTINKVKKNGLAQTKVHACCDTTYGKLIKCGNKGGNLEPIHGEIITELRNYLTSLNEVKLKLKDANIYDKISKEIESKESEQKSVINKINKISDLVLEGFFDVKEGKQKKNELVSKLDDLENEIVDLRKKYQDVTNYNVEDRINRIETLLEKLDNKDMSYEELNKLYKSIIHSIQWLKEEEDTVEIEINFI